MTGNQTKNQSLDLDAIKEALNKATPRPWINGAPSDAVVAARMDARAHDSSDLYYGGPLIFESAHRVDKDLIVLVMDSLPALIEAAEDNERLREALGFIAARRNYLDRSSAERLLRLAIAEAESVLR